jgi:Hint domain
MSGSDVKKTGSLQGGPSRSALAAAAGLPCVPVERARMARISPCFTPGTQIATQHGEISVEKLRVGDRVITRDNGMQEIRWIGKAPMFVQDFQAYPHLMPVLIRQGALGHGLPERDLLVSPNHRILVANNRTSVRYHEPEVLVAAKHLTAGHAVQTVESSGTTYIHLLFDRHEVVLSNGAWTESFQPSDQSLKSLGNAQRLELFEIFPGLDLKAGGKSFAPVRRSLGPTSADTLKKS